MNQEDQSSQITLPEPIAGHSNNGYRVRIGEVGSDKFRCSEDFYLLSSVDASVLGEAGGPTMTVVSPNAGAMAVAGEIYTVEVSFFFSFARGPFVESHLEKDKNKQGLMFVHVIA